MSAKWIWYRGDFEIYHGMLQNFSREERGFGWPAYWKMDDWHKNVKFSKEYDIEKDTDFQVIGRGTGYVTVDAKKHPLETTISLKAGHHRIEVFLGNMTGLPCIFIDADGIRTDESWLADNFIEAHPAGVSSFFGAPTQDPNQVPYTEEPVSPKVITEQAGGVLYDFCRMLNHASLAFHFSGVEEITVAYGESEAEALDLDWCYYKQEHVKADTITRQRAFRYVFIPQVKKGQVELKATHRQVVIPVRASFTCDNDKLNRIWEVAKETYVLCSELFFIDGIKRDRWIWAGDAYQSFFVNPYLFFDPEISMRTIRAVRGNTHIDQHLNTIVDYSMLWLISLWNEYVNYGDAAFLKEMLPKAKSMMELLLAQTDEKGFLYGRDRDWIYIDWAEMDKEGTISAEQILLWKCLQVMAKLIAVTGEGSSDAVHQESTFYEEQANRLKDNIFQYFWDEEKKAFIDCYESGRRNITRHANIFAVLFDLVEEGQAKDIIEGVLLNERIPAITTPYFKFYELDVLGKTGHLDIVMDNILSYWGGMLDEGAVTFWEQYDPTKSGKEHYEMYGDPFGKSLCHAWAASPIYLIGRYFLGVRPTSVGYATYEVSPAFVFFKHFEATVPIGEKTLKLSYQNGSLSRVIEEGKGTK